MEWFRRGRQLFYSSLNFRCEPSTESQADSMCPFSLTLNTKPIWMDQFAQTCPSVDCRQYHVRRVSLSLASETRKSINCSHLIGHQIYPSAAVKPNNESSHAIFPHDAMTWLQTVYRCTGHHRIFIHIHIFCAARYRPTTSIFLPNSRYLLHNNFYGISAHIICRPNCLLIKFYGEFFKTYNFLTIFGWRNSKWMWMQQR